MLRPITKSTISSIRNSATTWRQTAIKPNQVLLKPNHPKTYSSTTKASSSTTTTKASPPAAAAKYAKTRAGTGNADGVTAEDSMIPRGPVSWVSLGLVAVAAATAVGYYQIERERRLEEAMGKIVSSESDGWSPNPEYFSRRKFKKTKYGWFPVEDAFGGGAFVCLFVSVFVFVFVCFL